MKRKYKILGGVAMAGTIALSGLLYHFGGFATSDWVGPVSISGFRADKEAVRELLEKKGSVEQLRSLLGPPTFEFSGSRSEMQIYRQVTEFKGGTKTLFGLINLGDDHTSIENIWIVEILDSRAAKYQFVRRIYYPMKEKDVIFGLDGRAYDHRNYWIHNRLPD